MQGETTLYCWVRSLSCQFNYTIAALHPRGKETGSYFLTRSHNHTHVASAVRVDQTGAVTKINMNIVRSPTRCGLKPGVGRSDSQPNLASADPDISEATKITLRGKRKQPDDNEYIRTELSEIRNQMAQMMSMLTKLTTNQSEFTQKISNDVATIKEQITQIKLSTDNLAIEQNVIKSDIVNIRQGNTKTDEKLETLQYAVELLKNSTNNTSSSSQVFNKTQEDIIAEVNEREVRSRNIIIIGLSEPVSSNKEERIELDKNEVSRIMKNIDSSVPEPQYIMRLGKYNAHKIRPVKVCFKSQDIAKSILRHRHEAKYDNIKIYSDQTPEQQRFLKHIKEELQRRLENENKNLTIKYIKGIPRIVELTSKNYKQ